MNRVRTLVVGAGLSGLYAAWQLEQAGDADYVVLEARPDIGGRIRAIAPDDARSRLDRLDLGATWFWPDMQPNVLPLLQALGLPAFEQDDAGDLLIERNSFQPPLRLPGQGMLPQAWRVAGGMRSLVEALQQRMSPGRLQTAIVVTTIRRTAAGIQVEAADRQGEIRIWHTDRVLLAVPPRLAINRLVFEPALPPDLVHSWTRTTTHMAPHAKYVASFDRAFWKELGLSGQARSMVGPLGEIHDASQGGLAALFGFLLMPAQQRQSIAPDALLAHCRAQLGRLFGPQAQTPRLEALQDWASEPFTATAQCATLSPSHLAPLVGAAEGPWAGRIAGAASEWSPAYPGYVAGAIDAPLHALRWVHDRAPAVGAVHARTGLKHSSEGDNAQ